MTKTSTSPRLWQRLSPARLLRRPNNVFGMLVIVAGVAIVLRLVNVATYALGVDPDSAGGVTRTATAQQAAAPASPTDEDAPPISQADLDRAAAATAQAPAADTAAAPAAAPTPVIVPDTTTPPPSAVFSPTDGREFSEAELDVLQSLSKRREELDMRERNLNESAAMLKAAEKEVDRKLGELNTLKAEIEKLLGTQEKVEEQRITSLVKIYEAMKPKEAAIIFNTLDPDVLLSVVSRMNERRLSPVLASMDPDKARMVTIRLAEQRQLPGAAPLPSAAGPAPAMVPAGSNDASLLDSPVLNLPDTLPADTPTP